LRRHRPQRVAGGNDPFLPLARRRRRAGSTPKVAGSGRLGFGAKRDQAAKRQVFSRGVKAKAQAPVDLATVVDRLLEEETVQFLSIVNKAGLVVSGAFKVEETIRSGAVIALINASEASKHGVAKLERLAGPSVARISLFSSGQLDLALGRTNVIHAALCEGEASAAFLRKARRLARYRDKDTEIPSEAAQPGEGGGEAAAGETDGRA
jgi:uncharacterized protein